MAPPSTTLQVHGRDVVVTNPDKEYFPAHAGHAAITKLQIVQYYLDVAPFALLGLRGRPMILKRHVNGIGGEPFYQKRVPPKRPAWIETATLKYARGTSAEEIVVNDAAALAYVVNLGCVEMHVHPIRSDDLDHPDELRIDLDPTPGMSFAQVVEVALCARDALHDVGLVGWPKTSGSRGIHIWVRIQPKWPFLEVRRAALAISREVERRMPGVATSTWQKEDRRGVLLDYNQNAFDRTTCAAYSLRANAEARVSMPLTWAELATCNPSDFTMRTVPSLVKTRGDAHADIDQHTGTLDKVLALADTQPDQSKVARAPKKAAGARKPAVLVIARAKTKVEAMEGLERWKARHADVVAHLQPDDVIVDANRGASSAWYRIRIALRNVPEALRPDAEPPDPDYDPKMEYEAMQRKMTRLMANTEKPDDQKKPDE
jgi:bifunctional non-homologous end joining protein LigD